MRTRDDHRKDPHPVNDRGSSCRSAIFTVDDEQRRTALDTIADVDASRLAGACPRARRPRPDPLRPEEPSP